MIHSGEAALQNQTHRPCLLPANYWQSLGGKQRATAQEPSPQGKAARMSNRWLCKWLHPISTSIICTPLRSVYETVPGTGSCIGTQDLLLLFSDQYIACPLHVPCKSTVRSRLPTPLAAFHQPPQSTSHSPEMALPSLAHI